MDIKIVTDTITLTEVRELAKKWYGTIIKGVIDIEKEIVALGGEYHMDANMVLLENGSQQENIWGFNLCLNVKKDSPRWIEYIALINIRPRQNNQSMEIKDKNIRNKTRKILNKRVQE